MNASLIRLLAGLAALWLVLLGPTPTALAHAVLLSVDPADGAIVEEAPARIALTFNEPVTPLAMTMVTPDGERRDLLERATGGRELVVDLPDGLPDGTYLVSWRAVSIDGHPIGGVTAFSIGVATGESSVGAARTDPVVSGALWSIRLALHCALFFGVGGAVFAVQAPPLPPPAGGLAGMAVALGLVVVPVSLGLQGVDALGLGLVDLFGTKAWKAGFSTSHGSTAVCCLAALLLAGSSLIVRHRLTPALAIAALLLAPLALALSGHAGAAEPQWITRPALFLHIAGIVFWAGALLPLLILLAKGGREASAPLARFSAIVPYPVAAILVSGIVLASIQMGPRPAFWLSSYGAIFAGKLCMLAALFGLAAWNRFGLTQAVLDGDARAGRRLRRSVGAEAVLVLAVLGLVAGWRFTPPPRALADVALAPIELSLHAGAAMAEIAIIPGRTGTNTLAILVAKDDGERIAPWDMSVAVSSPALGMEPSRRPAELRDDGLWHVPGVSIPLAGEWQIDLEIRPGRFELVRMTGSFIIP